MASVFWKFPCNGNGFFQRIQQPKPMCVVQNRYMNDFEFKQYQPQIHVENPSWLSLIRAKYWATGSRHGCCALLPCLGGGGSIGP